jgi:hypothetical protein
MMSSMRRMKGRNVKGGEGSWRIRNRRSLSLIEVIRD